MRSPFPLVLALAFLAFNATTRASDAYLSWAAGKWGAASVANSAAKNTTWGESADPDKDGLPNLVEYAADTDPTRPNQATDCYEYVLPSTGVPSSRYPQLYAWQRTDDPDLRITCQKSSNLRSWLPEVSGDFNGPAPANLFIHADETGNFMRSLRQVRYTDLQSMASRSTAFMRLVVTRRGVSASSPGIEPFTFTSQNAVPPGGTVRSNAIVVGGFTGLVTINIPAGVTLFVNGIAQVGATAAVKEGDTVWMEAKASFTPNVPRNHTLSIGGYPSVWSYTTGSLEAVPDHPGADSGYAPVSANVSDTGAAQISVPVIVSPGVAGMQPTLSINYSSQGGNGPLGLGFSLGGLSVISRTGATVAQDGFKGTVAFDADDRFAFDGQRLIAINGAYGADGTEYRLEFDPTTRIRSYGTEGSGPQRWSVETKAGLTLDFGLSANSRIMPEGGSAPVAWTVGKISDSLGNAMIFTNDDAARQRGEVLISRVAYTSNSSQGLVANQEVVWEYEDRPDQRTSYIGGFALKMTKRLKALESRATDAGIMKRIRRYEMVFQQDPINDDSKLTKITEMTTDGTALPPTRFEWAASEVSGYLTSSSGTGFSIYAANTSFVADFNGDGRSDYLQYHAPSSNYQYNLHLSSRSEASGFSPFIATGIKQDSNVPPIPADFNGDGRTDVLCYKAASQKYDLHLSNGSGFDAAIPTDLAHFNDGYRPMLPGDFNGDGRTDMLVWNLPYNNGRYNLYLSTGTGFQAAVATNVVSDGYKQRPRELQFVGEFNGDGKADLLIFNTTRDLYDLYLSNGSGFGTPIQTDVMNQSNPYAPNIVGDYNGDGLTDILTYHIPFSNYRYNIHYCKGAGFTPAAATDISAGYDGTAVKYRQSVDYNGDGRMDMITWHTPANDYRYHIWISTGDGFKPAVTTSIAYWNTANESGDFNGDGKTDMLVWNSPVGGQMNQFLNNGPETPLVQKVVNGHGGATTFSYKPLTDSSIYTKGSGMAYPCSELQVSMYVVSSMSSLNGVDGNPFTGAGSETAGYNTVSYRYEGAWSCLDGRGFQGFKAVTVKDEATGIVSRSENLPLKITRDGVTKVLGSRPARSEQRLGPEISAASSLISERDTVSVVKETVHGVGRSTYFVTEESVVERAYETNLPAASALVRTVTRDGNTFDQYSNPLSSRTTTTGGGETHIQTVTNTYSDAPTSTKWHLGRLATSSVTKTGPNPAGGGNVSLTRGSSFSYHPTTGLLTREVVEPGGGALKVQKDYSHDGCGNILTSTVSAAGETARTTTTTYTADRRFVATTKNAKGHVESKTHDPLLGNVLTQTGPNGLVTGLSYDFIGRPVQETRPDGTVSRSFYRRVTSNTSGAPPRAVHYVRVQSSGSAPKTVWYDLLDREIRTDNVAFDGRTVSSHKVFNNRGEVSHASVPYFTGEAPLYSTMTYDAVGRETGQIDPGNRISKTTHAGLSTTMERNHDSAAPAQFQKTITTVNAMGWTVLSSQYLGNSAKTVSRKYDPYGQLRFVTDQANNITELRYDVRGNKIWMSEPNSGISTFGYNGYGELKSQSDAANQTTLLTYDLLGRILTRTEQESDGPVTTSFIYDTAVKGIGQLASESNGDFSRTYYYDHFARPVASVERHGVHRFPTSRSYDPAGRPDSLTYPTGFATRQVYTANGHLREVQNAANPLLLYWRALVVNARGQVESETLGNGVKTTRGFDPNSGLISTIRSGIPSDGAGTNIQNLSFDFDLIGNLGARRDKRFSTTFEEIFGYDSLNRLTSVESPASGDVVNATYTDNGNLRFRTDVGNLIYPSPGTARPHAVSRIESSLQGLSRTFTYNAKGERVTDGQTTLDYSSFGKPVRIRKGEDTLRFDYGTDHSLARQTLFKTSQTNPASQTVREYVGGIYERETNNAGMVRHIHYIAGGNGVVAILTDERNSGTGDQRTRFIHKDHLGSVDVITDSSGEEVERQSFDAWGRRRNVTHASGVWTVSYPSAPSSQETHRGFTGHEMLDAVGLVHMGGRVYDPITARFLSPDPFVQSPDNLQNLNRYSYVLNNPLSFTDPSGFFFKSIAKFIGKHWKTIAAVAVGIVTGGMGAWAAVGFSGTFGASLTSAITFASSAAVIGAGAGYGLGAAFSGTLLAGGSIADAMRAGLKGGMLGAATAAIGFQAGEYLSSGTGTAFSRWAGREGTISVATGVTETTTGILTGNGNAHGFVSNAVNAGLGAFGVRVNAVLPGSGLIISAAVGGTVAQIGGGKFANGAITSAFSHLLVQGLTEGRQASLQSIVDGAGKLWNLPNTLVGAAWGVMGMPFGANVTLGFNAVQFENHPFTIRAVTIGNVISYNGGDYTPKNNGLHELQHTFQGETLGPIYLPSNILGQAGGLLFNGTTHGPTNWNEVGPQLYPPSKW